MHVRALSVEPTFNKMHESEHIEWNSLEQNMHQFKQFMWDPLSSQLRCNISSIADIQMEVLEQLFNAQFSNNNYTRHSHEYMQMEYL
jgi:hypothetical protein